MALGDNENLLDTDQVKRAVHALNEYVAEKNKLNLISAMDEVEPISLQFTLKTFQVGESVNFKIPLPHSLVHSRSDVCLFVKDLDRTERDFQPTIKHYKRLLAQNGVTSIAAIVPLKQIKIEYQPFEAKRNLSNMYDTFLADSSIMRLLPQLLGKAFYGGKRIPVQVNMDAANLKKEIDKALLASPCAITGRGSSVCVKVAHSGQDEDHAVENIMEAAQKVCASAPGGAVNIRNMYIRTAESPALPIYVSHDQNLVELPKRPKKRSMFETEPEEVDFVDGAKVKVTAGGDIRFIPTNQKAQKVSSLENVEATTEKRQLRDKKGGKSDEKEEKHQKSEKVEAAGKGGKAKRKRKAKNESEKKRANNDKTPNNKAQTKRKAEAESDDTKADAAPDNDARPNNKRRKVDDKQATPTSAVTASEENTDLENTDLDRLEIRREDIDADLFSDTTADSELSEAEEPIVVEREVAKVKDNNNKNKNNNDDKKKQMSAASKAKNVKGKGKATVPSKAAKSGKAKAPKTNKVNKRGKGKV